MSKDKTFGLIILLLGFLMIIFYIIWAPMSLIYDMSNGQSLSGLSGLYDIGFFSWKWALVIPMTIMVLLIGALAAWIGYSMISTPPPVPLEELEEELEAEEAANAESAENEEESSNE
ncbi:MAG: hypothetical protein ACTSWC_01860 [Promethearchaeota archaeon]